ncbi:MAG: hypothetical protein IJL85_00105 [Erysipelotrichaceae bacterium]|nr:hypothetical protein [Erysipelotrichaceae bacterium]
MCDTIGTIINEHKAIFAKNSDRSPNEAQVIEFIEHRFHEGKKLECTYISIDQVKETNAMVLSRPTWLWGAEMGVNEHGVCIGNEAVFTKGRYGQESLIGMDLLRLGLERGNTAFESMQVIISLLEKYGQGGNCGYDKDFRYDNSFLIMDRKEIYVLETAGKKWAYKKYEHATISNRLTLKDDCDYYSDEKTDFRKRYSDLLFSTFSCASSRQQMTCRRRMNDIYDAFANLRQHSIDDPMCHGSVSSVCMHAGDLFADQTTSSMVVELDPDRIRIYVTGSSRPCLSLFKVHDFKKGGIIHSEQEKGESLYWYRIEGWQRKLLGKKIPQEFYKERDALERKLISSDGLNQLEIEKDFLDRWSRYPFKDGKCSIGFKKIWDKKNSVFSEEYKKTDRETAPNMRL